MSFKLNKIIHGDCLEVLKNLPDESVDCCVTSPPYYGLRDYSHHAQLGLEETPDLYIAKLVEVFTEVRRVLKRSGTLWLNMGDSYCTNATGNKGDKSTLQGSKEMQGIERPNKKGDGLKRKDLIGIPWMLAFALRSGGWYLRQDIIWCLSGGTWVYVKSQKGVMPMMVRDLARLKTNTCELWNGEKWTSILGMSKSKRCGEEIEILLRSGERISCTPTHKFPTNKGLLIASELRNGNILKRVILPEPEFPKDSRYIGQDVAWFIGLYIAEGSRSGDCIQIAGHSREEERWERLKHFTEDFGCYTTRTIDGNKMDIRLYGKVINALIDQFVSGRTAKDKCLTCVCWRYSNKFLRSLLDGYLSGDGYFDKVNSRWRIGFTRNYNLERDLRTLAARLDFQLTLKISNSNCNGKSFPSFKGEIRFENSNHHNCKDKNEIVEIRKARCREVYDLGVADEPHLFALASGILTHNSKPNPMPESVTDRCTKSHEYIFLLSKSQQYYYDAEAIKTPIAENTILRLSQDTGTGRQSEQKRRFDNASTMGVNGRGFVDHSGYYAPDGRLIGNGKANKRSVWTVTSMPFKEAHFATFPQELIVDCIKAGTSEYGVCSHCGKPYERVTVKELVPTAKASYNTKADGRDIAADGNDQGSNRVKDGHKPGWVNETETKGWQASCRCNADVVPAIVLDPFMGAGTTAIVARKLGRNFCGIEINEEYIKKIADKRLKNEIGLFL